MKRIAVAQNIIPAPCLQYALLNGERDSIHPFHDCVGELLAILLWEEMHGLEHCLSQRIRLAPYR